MTDLIIFINPDILALSPTFPATAITAENVISGTRHFSIIIETANTAAERTGSNAAALTVLQHVNSIKINTGVSFVIKSVICEMTSVPYESAVEKQERASPLITVKKVKNAAFPADPSPNELLSVPTVDESSAITV